MMESRWQTSGHRERERAIIVQCCNDGRRADSTAKVRGSRPRLWLWRQARSAVRLGYGRGDVKRARKSTIRERKAEVPVGCRASRVRRPKNCLDCSQMCVMGSWDDREQSSAWMELTLNRIGRKSVGEMPEVAGSIKWVG